MLINGMKPKRACQKIEDQQKIQYLDSGRTFISISYNMSISDICKVCNVWDQFFHHIISVFFVYEIFTSN